MLSRKRVVAMNAAPFHGLLVIDKPGGMTSRDAVDRAARWFPRGTRLGHTGTLDPLATGVLVLCLGSATRLTEYVQDMEKTYRTGILLGARSDTDDADGTVERVSLPGPPPDREQVAACLAQFVGEIEQVPPAYSAAKVGGRRAYGLARRGQVISLQPRRVRIHAIELLAYEYPRLDVLVRCGKGTYIRSLARDLGEQLGCGALVESLRRTRVGSFEAEQGLSLEADATAARARLLPMSAAVSELASITLSSEQLTRLAQGQKVPLFDIAELPESTGGKRYVAVLNSGGELAAIAVLDPAGGQLLPSKVLSGR